MTWCDFIHIACIIVLICSHVNEQWIIIDAKVYNVSKFKDMHPGGASVFFDEEIRKSIQTAFWRHVAMY